MSETLLIPDRLDYNICEQLISPNYSYHLRISADDFTICKKIQRGWESSSVVDKRHIDTIRNLYVSLNNSEITERK